MTGALRAAAVLVALVLLARVAFGTLFAHADGVPALRAMIREDLGRVERRMGIPVAARARAWAAAVRKAGLPFGAGPDGPVAPGLESDLARRLQGGTGGMRRVFSLNLQMAAARLAALSATWPFAALALAVGLANGVATRHARRHRLDPESAFVFRGALAALWLPAWGLAAYVAVPVSADPVAVAHAAWTVAGTAAFLAAAFFKKRL